MNSTRKSAGIHARPISFKTLAAVSLLAMVAARHGQAQQLTATPYHPSGIYDLGEKVGWNLALPGASAASGSYSYTIKTNNSATIASGTLDLSSGKATLETMLTEPAMVYVQITPPRGAGAAGANPGAAQRGPGGRGAGPNPGPGPALPPLDTLQSDLTLTDTQAAAIKPLLDEIESARQGVLTAQTQSNQQRMAAQQKISALLTEAQRPQLAPVFNPPPPTRGAPGGRGGRGNGTLTLGAAVAPAKFQPAVPRPADFDAFWDGKLKILAGIPINPQLTPTPTNQAGVEFYTVQLDSVDSHVQGYLAKPAKEGKFPALIIYQWAGVYALTPSSVTNRARDGWLTFDVDSHDLPPSQATGVSSSYQAIGNDDREKSYFLDMYLRDQQAINYITSRPDWDGRTIVLMGTSMGGQQSLVAAGLNPRITAVIVNEPSGADSNGDLHGRKAGYPNWPSNNPAVMQTGLYFDTVNFAGHIKAPSLIAMGFIDTTAPPIGILTAFDQIPGAKEAVPMIESEHNNITPEKQGAFNSRSEEVLKLILNGGQFTPNEASLRP